MRPRTCLVAIAAVAALASLTVPNEAQAGGAVLGRSDAVAPAVVDMRIAVAATPRGTTRWAELVVGPSSRAMWLVPARPGAAIDWASDSWINALDEATAVRVLAPTAPTDCVVPTVPERAPHWADQATTKHPSSITVHTDAAGARAHAASRGYEIPAAVEARIASLYERGWNLVALEIEPSWSVVSTGTLRVSDDGEAAIPLALTGTSTGRVRVTAFTIGPGVATVAGAEDVDGSALRWSSTGSTYGAWRESQLIRGRGAAWLRESAGRALFEETPIPGTRPAPAVVRLQTCAAEAVNAGRSDGPVGTACAAGALARVPGGEACQPSRGAIDPMTFTCAGSDDLALALSGSSPKAAIVTRWAGLVSQNALGEDLTIRFDPSAAHRSPAVRSGGYGTCAVAPETKPLEPPADSRVPVSTEGEGERTRYVTDRDGCGGSSTSTSTVYVEEDEPAETTTTDECSGSTTTSTASSSDDESSDSSDDDSSDSDDEGWDTDDDSESSSSSDACSGGSSSSSSGGDSDDGWDSDDSWDSDDGWDTEDGMRPQHRKTRVKTTSVHKGGRAKKRPASPVSRFAFLAVALLLPLRRRGRKDRETPL